MITIKTRAEIELMREAGKIAKMALDTVEKNLKPGVTTKYLNDIAERVIRSSGATPSFLGYRGFPASICASINEVVIHGIPSNRKIVRGDIVSVDVAAYYKGFHGDMARTFTVGEVSERVSQLIAETRNSFFEGLKFARVGNRIEDISSAIQQHVEMHGFSVVEKYVGHGIGRNLHEDPEVPNFGRAHKGLRLRKGMTLAIEPMVNEGGAAVEVLDDNWTVVTCDRKLAAHYENTILITDGEPEVLTI